jgi:hypothetical protein
MVSKSSAIPGSATVADDLTINANTAVPEPATLGLWFLGLSIMAARFRHPKTSGKV